VKIPGMRLFKKAERTGNEVEVPMARDLGLVDLLKRTYKEVGEDHLMAFAASLTYNGLFALFPFFIFLLSLLGVFKATGLVNDLIDSISPVMPREAAAFVQDQLLAITESRAEGVFTVGAVISLVVAMWGASRGYRSVMEAMNVVYGVEEGRPLWKRYLASILLSLAVVALVLSALLLLVFGSEVSAAAASAFGFGAFFERVSDTLEWPVLASFGLLAFALVYYFAPDVEQRFKWVSLGAVVAFAFRLLFSLLFSLLVNSFGSFNATHGSLAGVAVFMLYLYYSSFIMLVGAEMNQIIEEHIPEGKNGGERVPGVEKR
jgi:membrane protein